MIENPIFIVGTERSGSNLLRLLLNAHPNIAIPHPPHIMRELTPLLPYYGDLSEEKNFLRLAEAVSALVRFHFAPWPFIPKPSSLVSESPSKTLYGLFAALNEQYRRHENKARWGCKSTFMIHHIEDIIIHHSAPRIIHLIRDPRDVAVSAAGSVFSNFHPAKIGELWLREQAEIERWKHLRQDGRMMLVWFEDLVIKPQVVLQKLMDFLGEPFVPGQMKFFQEREAARLSKMSKSWRRLSEPVNSSRAGRYHRELTPKAIAYVERAARPMMVNYGYDPVTAKGGLDYSAFKKFRIEFGEIVAKYRVELSSIITDRNAWLRLRKKVVLKSLLLQQKVRDRLAP